MHPPARGGGATGTTRPNGGRGDTCVQAKSSLLPRGSPSAVFSASRPAIPVAWAGTSLLLGGDIETNPGPPTYTCNICTRNITRSQYSIRCNHNTPHWVHLRCTNTRIANYTNTWRCPTHTTPQHNIPPQHSSQTRPNQDPPVQPPPTPPNTSQHQNRLNILQININGIRRKHTELEEYATQHKIDIILIQESKLTPSQKTPTIQSFTPIRTDRRQGAGGGLITYVKQDITFTQCNNPPNLNTGNIELQTIKIHLSQNKSLHICNIYIPPRDPNNPNHPTEDTDITNTITYLTSLPNSIIAGDINAHSDTWHSPISDHRGSLIENILQNSDHIILNENTPTRVPTHINQQSTSPDITTATDTLHRHITWNTAKALPSDHLPIIIVLNTKTKFRLQQNRCSYTNYN